MGEARRKTLAGLDQPQPHIGVKSAKFVVLIADHSEKGTLALKKWAQQYPEIPERIETWRETGFQFFVNLRNIDGSPQLTLMARNLNELTTRAIAVVMERVLSEGGLCANILAVDPGLVGDIERAFALLQPAVPVDAEAGV